MTAVEENYIPDVLSRFSPTWVFPSVFSSSHYSSRLFRAAQLTLLSFGIVLYRNRKTTTSFGQFPGDLEENHKQNEV